MSNFTPGHDFTNDKSLSIAAAHALVDNAYLINVDNPDFAAGTKFPYVATPASPATGDVRVGSGGLFEFYYGGVWNTQPSDAAALTLTNKSGVDLLLGDVVVADPANANSFTIATILDPPNMIGVLAANIANNASGLVYYRGFCKIKVLQQGTAIGAGALLRLPVGTASTTDGKTSANPTFGILAEGASVMGSMGMCFDAIPAGAGSYSVLNCRLWR